MIRLFISLCCPSLKSPHTGKLGLSLCCSWVLLTILKELTTPCLQLMLINKSKYTAHKLNSSIKIPSWLPTWHLQSLTHYILYLLLSICWKSSRKTISWQLIRSNKLPFSQIPHYVSFLFQLVQIKDAIVRQFYQVFALCYANTLHKPSHLVCRLEIGINLNIFCFT